MTKVLVVYGTRPEAIKLAPVVRAISESKHLASVVAVTGQHREMLDQVNSLFGIEPDYDLDIIRPRQTLVEVTNSVLQGISEVIERENPDAVLVQGDTTTCFVAALASFYRRIPVIHLEAGLRTGDVRNPFPEEVNRRMTTQLAALHLAPTPESRANLLHSGVDPQDIVVTGNSVIDALLDVVARDLPWSSSDGRIRNVRRSILVTAHRRESWGEPMACAARALARIARAYPEFDMILPVHLNPAVREVLIPALADITNVILTEPLTYSDFAKVMAASTLVLTDSGGVQEEAPSLGKPVLVMRDTTERPEAVAAGCVRLVGTNEDVIFDEVARLLNDPTEYQVMARAINPYGDGRAAARAVQSIESFFNLAEMPSDFSPVPSSLVMTDRDVSLSLEAAKSFTG